MLELKLCNMAVTPCNRTLATAMPCKHKPMLIHMAMVRQHIQVPAMACLVMAQLMEELMLECSMASKLSISSRHNINKSEQMLSCLLNMLPSPNPMVMAMLNNIDQQAYLLGEPAELITPFLFLSRY